MKRVIGIVIIIMFMAVNAYSAQVWQVAWGSITSATLAQSPSSYKELNTGQTAELGIPSEGASTITAVCFTVGASATDTDFNFMYDNQTANAHELCASVGAVSNCGWGISVGGSSIAFTADNNDAVDAVTPYCLVTITR